MGMVKVHVHYTAEVYVPDGMLANYTKHSKEFRELCEVAVRDQLSHEEHMISDWIDIIREPLECH